MGAVLIPHPGKANDAPPDEMVCGACNQRTSTRICPHCHFELSQDIGQIDQRIIAIVGGRATGKSHYIASLINRLNFEVGSNFNFEVSMMGEDTKERWYRDFYTPLFVNKNILSATQRSAIDPVVKSPLMFRFTFNEGKRRRILTVCFFDTAGEDMTSLTTMAENLYISHADAIIFLLDPLQIRTVRSQLNTQNMKLPQDDPKSAPENIVEDLRSLFENKRKVHPEELVGVPIAFTLSKIDMLSPILAPGSVLKDASNHHIGDVDLSDVQAVHTEISTFMEDWINPVFITKIKNRFSHFQFFGVSALGEPPDPQGHLTTVSPLRVEDPFLWVLLQLGLIGKQRKWYQKLFFWVKQGVLWLLNKLGLVE